MFGLFFTGTNEMVDSNMIFGDDKSAQKFVDQHTYLFDEEVSVEVRPLGNGIVAGNFYMIAGYSSVGQSRIKAV